MCQKKLHTNLKGLMTVAESSDWFAWPDGPSTKNEQCSPAARLQIFRIESNKKGQIICQGGKVFCQVRTLFCQVGTFICQ